MKVLISSLLLAALVASCSFGGQRYSKTAMGNLNIGSSPAEVEELLGMHYIDDGSIDAGYYMVAERQTSVTYSGTRYTHDLYYFESNKLVYWGSFDDFKTHDNKKLRKVGETVADRILN